MGIKRRKTFRFFATFKLRKERLPFVPCNVRRKIRKEGIVEKTSSFSVHGYLNYWISGIGLVALEFKKTFAKQENNQVIRKGRKGRALVTRSSNSQGRWKRNSTACLDKGSIHTRPASGRPSRAHFLTTQPTTGNGQALTKAEASNDF